jgi:hypothetical protein
MKSSLFFRGVFLFVLIAIANLAVQAAPILDSVSARVSYHGLLKATNLPANGTFNLSFNLYTSPGGVLLEGPVVFPAVQVNNGLFQVMLPFSRTSFDGTGRELGIRVNGSPELTPRQQIGALPYAYRVDRVASEELDDTISLGRAAAPFAAGTLNVQNGLMAQESIELVGSAHRISTYGSDGLEQIRLWGPTFGEIQLHDSTDNDITVLLSATSNSGGLLSLRDPDGVEKVSVDGGTGRIETQGGLYATTSVGTNVASLERVNTNSMGRLTLGTPNGVTRAVLDGTGKLSLNGTNGVTRIAMDPTGAANAGAISVFDADGTPTATIVAAEAPGTGSQITLRNGAGQITMEFDAEFVGTTNHARLTTGELLAKNRMFVGNTTLSLGAGSTLTPDCSYVRLSGSGGNVTLNATTAIANGELAGQMLILEGRDDAATVTIPNGANTQMPAARTLGQGDVLTLIWNGTDWLLLSFSNN